MVALEDLSGVLSDELSNKSTIFNAEEGAQEIKIACNCE